MRQDGGHLAAVTMSSSTSDTHPWLMEPHTCYRLCKVLPKCAWSITSFGVASPQLQGESVHFGHSPVGLPWYQMFWGIFLAAVLFCHYHHTVFKSKTHFFYFFLIFVYSSIILNTTNSSFPCLSWKKIPKYAPKWPAQHLNHHQITLRFSFKQYSLLGPVSCKKLK